MNNRAIAKAASIVIILTLVSRLLGFVREQAIAFSFGAGGETDAYVVALTLPQLVINILGGALTAAFLPIFTSYISTGDKEKAWGLARTLFSLSIIFGAAVVLLGVLGSRALVMFLAPGFSAELTETASNLTKIIFPGFFFLSLGTIAIAILHSFRSFAVPALGPAVLSISIIISVFTLVPKWGIFGLAAGTLLGMILQFILVAVPLFNKGFKYRPALNLRHPGLAETFHLALPVMVGALFGQIYPVIDRILGSSLAEGSIAALNFALKLQQLPIGVFVVAVSTVIFPALSEHAARKDLDTLGRTFSLGLRMVFLLTIPFAVGLAVLRVPVVKLLFERGAFGSWDTWATSYALLFYAIGILGHAGVLVTMRAFHALKNTITPVKLRLLALLVNVTLDFILIRYLAHAGLALANSIAVIVNLILLYIALQKILPGLPRSEVAKSFAKVFVSAGVMGVALLFIRTPVFRFADAIFDGGSLSLLFGLLLTASAGAVLYIVGLTLLRAEELDLVLKLISQRFIRRTPAH